MNGRIFNIGLNRAGSGSLAEALDRLGYRTAHCVHEGRRLYRIASENLRAGRRAFDGIDDRYDAFLDFAGYRMFPLLDRHYPGSRFIVTYRDLESWLASRERKVRRNQANPGCTKGFVRVDRAAWARLWRVFLASVKAHFEDRPDHLLVIDIPGGEGWEQLCRFLDHPVPDVPFPHRNRLAR